MASPASISCPHCAASFNIKSQAAFGKKVKCPKCETPFVIEKPARKSSSPRKQPSRRSPQDDEFGFEDESDEPLFLEEDETDWEDDLSDGPAVRPAKQPRQKPKPTRKKSKSQQSFLGALRKYGFSPFVVFPLAILLCLYGFFFVTGNTVSTTIVMFIVVFFAMACTAVGGIGLLILAAEESFGEFLLCFFVPLYSLFYAITRFERTKGPFAAIFSGVVVYLVVGLTLIIGKETQSGPFAKDGPGGRAQNNVAQVDPDADVDLEDLKEFHIQLHTPLPLEWAEPGNTSANVFQERPSASIGRMFEVTSSPDPDQPDAPASRMKFRVFLPPKGQGEKFPCVIVPPAGSTLLTGMEIDDTVNTQNPEHEPYVKAGFAVITFSIDGDLGAGDQTSNAEFIKAHEAFRRSKAGMLNYAQALSLAKSTIPEIDTSNIFLAGHSSAATLSLLFAEHSYQHFWDPDTIKGCLAYAPSVDPQKFFANHLGEIKPLIPDVEEFIRLSSPKEHAQTIQCPVFLFHARGDQVTSFVASRQFAEQLKAQGVDVKFVASNGSDHYQTMVDEGVPQGIKWIQAQLKAQPSQPQEDGSPGLDPQLAAMKQAAQSRINKTRQTKRKIDSGSSASAHLEKMRASLEKVRIARDGETRRYRFQIAGFTPEFEQKLKKQAPFFLNSLESSFDVAILGTKGDNVIINFYEMTITFDYAGELPQNLREKIANQKSTKVMLLSDAPLKNLPIDNESAEDEQNIDLMTFRIESINRLRFPGDTFNPIAAQRMAERSLRGIKEYIPDSLVMNYDQKWAAIKVKANDDKFGIEIRAESALSSAGIRVDSEWIKLKEADLTSAQNLGNSSPDATPSSPGNMPPAATAKQKYIIHYGVYGGDDVTDSARRLLKGFVWVDQETVHFNPDKKEITFENRSAVDQGALDRALKRNKFYQVMITREAVPESPAEKTSDKAGAGTE
ncbi:MJ0042-type zinc finger domain-containing protein [Gimesia chilikensis]|uniref:MJ0042-type zinc finger domain-containing protein n=1 Tax=Gimesia chilikensis TaxID=2605989 RepID=UPI00118968A9|nr:MJ0042-type zinc finger domain-containing protein [Gimesia chilikensis]QDT86758.1 Alpha/beta hydrolase family protein [Gimesia chilikensis]